MNQAEVERRLQAALRLLSERDGYLLDVGAHERAITHRLGMYLQGQFHQWDVDCEYNRDGHEPKRVGLDEGSFAGESSVYPDIIIHRRGREGPNLLVIEAKTYHNRAKESVQRDRQKLEAYKRDLHYDHAVFLEVWTGTPRPDPAMQWV